MSETLEIRSNRIIDSMIMAGEMEIDQQFAMDQLANYLNELQLIEAGAKLSDLGISERRKSSFPAVISANGLVSPRDGNIGDSKEIPAGSIAHLKLNGVMRSGDGMSNRGVQRLADDLQAAYSNPNITGILIEANTGGGENIAGQILQSAISSKNKPVVVYAHFLASAGIRGTVNADEIIASSSSAQFGSIGTFMTISKSFKEWYNRNFDDIYAEKSTNKNKEFRSFLEGDKSGFMKMINKSNDFFTKEVKNNRPLNGDIDHTLSGALFHAREARRRGLIDSIGNFAYALRRIQTLAKRQNN